MRNASKKRCSYAERIGVGTPLFIALYGNDMLYI